MKKKFYPLVDGVDLRTALGFESQREFVEVNGQDTCIEMPLEDDEIAYEISEAESAIDEEDDWAAMCARRLKNWRRVAEYIRENYEVPEGTKTVFVRVWW